METINHRLLENRCFLLMCLASNSWSVWMETVQAALLPTSLQRVLLPIREAYEWKRRDVDCNRHDRISCFQFVKRMNGNKNSPPSCPHPSYTCFQFVKRMNGNLEWLKEWTEYELCLLPIREAYEWKPKFYPVGSRSRRGLASNSWSVWMETFSQFRRCWLELYLPPLASNSWSVWMETFGGLQSPVASYSLASNSWSVWMETLESTRNPTLPNLACFQFVKRMNGNDKSIRSCCASTSCFQFVKRMNGNPKSDPPDATSHTLASNSWSVWMETLCQLGVKLRQIFYLLPIREAYEWKQLDQLGHLGPNH